MITYFKELSPILQALTGTLFTWFVTALGAAVVFLMKTTNKKVLTGMLAFAGGIMLAASFWSLLAPAIDLAAEVNQIAWLITAIGFLSGGALIILLDILLGGKNLNMDGKDPKKRSLLLILAITLHNIPEGLAVGVAFGAASLGIEGATLTGAIVLAIGIGLQNFPEGSAISIPLKRDGYSNKRAFFYGQLSGIVEPIAGVLGALLVITVRSILPFVLSFAAGAMVFVVINELIPESMEVSNRRNSTMFAMLGFTIMMILDVMLG